MAKETIPVVVIEYALALPVDRAGELVAKTVARLLKHNFGAKHVRIQLLDDARWVGGYVEKRHLESIRNAVQMTMSVREMHGGIIRDRKTVPAFSNLPPTRSLQSASSEQSGAQGDGDSGTPSGAVVQAQPEPAADDSPAVA